MLWIFVIAGVILSLVMGTLAWTMCATGLLREPPEGDDDNEEEEDTTTTGVTSATTLSWTAREFPDTQQPELKDDGYRDVGHLWRHPVTLSSNLKIMAVQNCSAGVFVAGYLSTGSTASVISSSGVESTTVSTSHTLLIRLDRNGEYLWSVAANLEDELDSIPIGLTVDASFNSYLVSVYQDTNRSQYVSLAQFSADDGMRSWARTFLQSSVIRGKKEAYRLTFTGNGVTGPSIPYWPFFTPSLGNPVSFTVTLDGTAYSLATEYINLGGLQGSSRWYEYPNWNAMFKRVTFEERWFSESYVVYLESTVDGRRDGSYAVSGNGAAGTFTQLRAGNLIDTAKAYQRQVSLVAQGTNLYFSCAVRPDKPWEWNESVTFTEPGHYVVALDSTSGDYVWHARMPHISYSGQFALTASPFGVVWVGATEAHEELGAFDADDTAISFPVDLSTLTQSAVLILSLNPEGKAIFANVITGITLDLIPEAHLSTMGGLYVSLTTQSSQIALHTSQASPRNITLTHDTQGLLVVYSPKGFLQGVYDVSSPSPVSARSVSSGPGGVFWHLVRTADNPANLNNLTIYEHVTQEKTVLSNSMLSTVLLFDRRQGYVPHVYFSSTLGPQTRAARDFQFVSHDDKDNLVIVSNAIDNGTAQALGDDFPQISVDATLSTIIILTRNDLSDTLSGLIPTEINVTNEGNIVYGSVVNFGYQRYTLGELLTLTWNPEVKAWIYDNDEENLVSLATTFYLADRANAWFRNESAIFAVTLKLSGSTVMIDIPSTTLTFEFNHTREFVLLGGVWGETSLDQVIEDQPDWSTVEDTPIHPAKTLLPSRFRPPTQRDLELQVNSLPFALIIRPSGAIWFETRTNTPGNGLWDVNTVSGSSFHIDAVTLTYELWD